MATTTAVVSKVSDRPAMWPRVLLVLGRLGLGGIFVFAWFAKLHFDGAWHFRDYHFFFAMLIDSYKILPILMVEWMARILPWFELFLGLWLIAGIGLRWSGTAASAILLVFIAAMARAKIMGLEINCGCFGNNEKLGTLTLLRDSTLLIFALAVTIGAFIVREHNSAISS